MFKLCKESGVNIGYGNGDYSFTFMFQRINNYLLEKRIKLDENVTLYVTLNVTLNVSKMSVKMSVYA